MVSTMNREEGRGATCDPRALGIDKVPVHQYVSEDFFEREKQSIWRRSWLLVGRASEIANPGDFFTFDLQVLNASIVVVRGRDGRVRAFHNACQHRGAKVRYQREGRCKALTCTFHGWVYGLDGRLLDVPFRDQFDDSGFDSLALKPVHLAQWGGFIFINLDAQPRWSIDEYLEPLPAALRSYFEQDSWQWYVGYRGVFEANWKIMVDVQAEGHHGPFLHRRTVPSAFGPEQLPAAAFPNSVGVPYWLGAYRPDDNSPGAIKLSAVSRLAFKYGIASLYTHKDSPSVMEQFPGAVNPPGLERWMFDDYTLFPNTVLLILDRQLIIQRCWPLSPHRTLWEINHYFADPLKNFGDLFNREHGVIGEWNTVTEDMMTVEGIHQSFRSGVVDGMYLSDLEVGVRSFERRVLQEVEGNGAAETGDGR